MPLPLLPMLLGAGGFFASRELDRRDAAAQQLGFKQAVQNFTRGGGEIAADGFGPPTNPEWGAGLTQQQLQGIRALNQVDSESALTTFIGMVQENRNQASADDIAEYRDASIENQNAVAAHNNAVLEQRKAEFSQKNIDSAQARQDELTKLGRLHAIGTDLDLAREHAAVGQKKFFTWMDPETKAAEVIHMPGSEAHGKVNDRLMKTTSALSNSTRLFDIIEQNSRTSDPSLAQTAELKQVAGMVGADVREMLELGVPTGPDIELMQALISDPTSFLNRIRQGDVAALEQLSGLNRKYGEDLANRHLQVRNWDMDPSLVQRGGSLLQQAQEQEQRQQGYRQAQQRIAADPASSLTSSILRGIETAGMGVAASSPLVEALGGADASRSRLAELREESARLRNPLGEGREASSNRTFGPAASVGRQVAGGAEELFSLFARFLRK